MSELSTAASPSFQSQPAVNSPLDVQHGIIKNRLWPIEMVNGRPTTLLNFYFLDGTKKQKKAVCTTIQKRAREMARKEYEQQKVGDNSPPRKKSRPSDNDSTEDDSESDSSEGGPRETPTRDPTESDYDFVTWGDCGNLIFRKTKNIAKSHIRITFEGNGNASWVGTTAESHKSEDSMRLADVHDVWPPSPLHRRIILHEFGHVLGLAHEHQGPAARKLLRLDKRKVKVAIGNSEVAKDNILDKVKKDEHLWNYTNFDTKSIMTYCLPEDWQTQEEKITIGWVLELSKVDQACIRLMYPPDLTKEENQPLFKEALNVVGVNRITAGEMIRDFLRNREGGDGATRLTRLRDQFYRWRTGLTFYKRDVGIMNGIDPASLRRSGINEFAGEVTRNKLFQGITKNIIYRAMVQHGIPTAVSIPGATQTEVTRLLAALSMHDEVGQLVRRHSAALSGNEEDDEQT